MRHTHALGPAFRPFATVAAVVIAVGCFAPLPASRADTASSRWQGARVGSWAPNDVGDHAPARRIGHVVVIFLENHSFDNVLGLLCVRYHRCDGASSGVLASGRRIKLKRASDLVPIVTHKPEPQRVAIDHGRMNGFSRIRGCTATTSPAYQCYSQFHRGQIPNLWRLARTFAISDATYSDGPVPSFGSHLDLVAQTLDGFTGTRPSNQPGGRPGWGCDSDKDAPWRGAQGRPIRLEPSCVPWYGLNRKRHPFGGAYRATPVRHVPTLMDRMSRAKLPWKIYAPGKGGGYGWAICPTFADCFYTSQRSHMVRSNRVIANARHGALPAVSLVMPVASVSQHNSWSMAKGDAWLGRVVSAIERGPDWSRTSILITYDDCGCFYDHARPPRGLGIRVPMVLVGPYVRRHYTDHRTASYSSIDRYIETTFGLRPLGAADATAYGYRASFDYRQTPTRPIRMIHTPVPPASLRQIAVHPPTPETT